jgi:hypothetical protein
MADESRQSVAEAMRRINRAWLEGRVEDLEPAAHPDIVVVLPGFAGRVQGRDQFLAGFRDFREGTTIHGFEEADQQFDVIGDAAVVSFRYELVYERAGERYRATGRDVWVFREQGGEWIAVWRAMLDMSEAPA